MRKALIGALAIAAVSTLGDFVWAEGHVRDRALFGLTHGTVLFLCIGAYLGAIEHQLLPGAIAGGLIGLIAAGSFYLLAPYAGYAVMFFIWAFVWGALAILTGRVFPKPRRLSWRAVITRAVIAATGSAITFYLISGIWRPFDPEGWDYAVHFLSWTVAYLPGFAALTAFPIAKS